LLPTGPVRAGTGIGGGMAAKDDLGRRGEDLATAHLEAQGLVVLSRNWRCAAGELDIVATDGISTVIFCEVKTRSGVGFGTPIEQVTMGKRRRIRRLSQIWLSTAKTGWHVLRFDVIGILFDAEGRYELQHIREAF
jgi:putative endonuclease